MWKLCVVCLTYKLDFENAFWWSVIGLEFVKPVKTKFKKIFGNLGWCVVCQNCKLKLKKALWWSVSGLKLVEPVNWIIEKVLRIFEQSRLCRTYKLNQKSISIICEWLCVCQTCSLNFIKSKQKFRKALWWSLSGLKLVD